VVFVALAYPSRQGLAEYLAYQNEVESTVARINERWATPGWTPIVLHVEDDYPRSLAALTLYDVLLVNPVRDGMNLVAKEGPLVNATDGVLALSREAGAFEELAGPALEVNPFDVGGTAAVWSQALSMKADERGAAAAALRELVMARSPADWFNEQLDQADRNG
jgi:trehalose 6-phosphate synthase